MRVKEIVIDGFKSYAKRTVIGNWDTQFNCITGLNGSGKSNISDAICFVLGITTMSTVRASNQQDSIYKRGQAGVTKANVSIVFDNTDKSKSPLDYKHVDTITVTRQVVSGGTSKYSINGHRAQQNQVQRSFQEVQSNVNNPNFLIMQGQITKVLNMQPTEISGLIEEAAGTGLYEKERQKAVREIRNRDGTLLETEASVNEEVKPRLEKLREKKRQFLEYQQCAASTEATEKVVAVSEWAIANEELRKMTQLAETNAIRVEELKAQINLGVAKQTELKTRLDQSKRESNTKESEKLEAELQAHNEEATRITGELEHKQQQLQITTDQSNASMAAVNSISSQLEAYNASIATFESQHGELQSEYNKQHKLAEEKKESLTGLQTGISTTGERETGYAYTTKKAREALMESQSRLDAAKAEHQKLSAFSLASQKAHFSELVANNEAKSMQTSEAEQKKRAELSTLSSSAEAIVKLRSEREESRDSIAVTSRSLEDLMNKFPNLDIPVDRSDPLAKSIKGRVAHVFRVQEQHNDKLLALETCAGGALWNLVVDNDQVGAAILKKARKRMTVLPLNRMRAQVINRSVIEQIDPNAAWLASDLIEFSEEVRPAVEHVFGRTVICATSKVAERAAFQFHVRSVTLAGDVFDPRGVISGGYQQQSKGSSSAAVREYQELAASHLQQEEKLAEISHEVEEVGQSASLAERVKNESDLIIHEIELNKKELAESQKRLAEATNGLERSSMLESKEIPELHAEIEARQNAVQTASKDAAEFTANRDGKSKQSQREVEEESRREQELSKQSENRGAEHSRHEFELAKLKADLVQETEARDTASSAIRESNEEVSKLAQQDTQIKQLISETDAKLKAELSRVSSVDSDANRLEAELIKCQSNDFEMSLESQSVTHSLESQDESLQAARRKLEQINKHWTWAEELAQAPGTTILHGSELQQLRTNLAHGQRRMKELSQRVDSSVLSSIQRLENDEASLRKRLSTIKEDRRKLEELMETSSERRRETINSVWRQVSTDFGLIFGDLLPNSTCELVPVDDQPIEKGFSIKVRLGGTWKEGLTESSGGQRSLVALSLILALSRYHPAPMYILDEVDAALDVHHTSNIGRIIKTRFKNAQFIVVSLKDDMFTNANRIYQTRFVDGTSTVSIVT